jgi:phenylpyruvate tautomerase PptA (4-oxalocrotonate tautomerase family)
MVSTDRSRGGAVGAAAAQSGASIMPLVRIDIVASDDARSTDERLAALGAAVHQAMTETIGAPVDDRFQIHTAHQPGRLVFDPDYMGVHRDAGVVFVSITLREGRTLEQKQALYRRITDLAAASGAAEPGNVFVTLTDNTSPDWSFGNGIAWDGKRPAASPPTTG